MDLTSSKLPELQRPNGYIALRPQLPRLHGIHSFLFPDLAAETKYKARLPSDGGRGDCVAFASCSADRSSVIHLYLYLYSQALTSTRRIMEPRNFALTMESMMAPSPIDGDEQHQPNEQIWATRTENRRYLGRQCAAEARLLAALKEPPRPRPGDGLTIKESDQAHEPKTGGAIEEREASMLASIVQYGGEDGRHEQPSAHSKKRQRTDDSINDSNKRIRTHADVFGPDDPRYQTTKDGAHLEWLTTRPEDGKAVEAEM